jgi:hypothetical protein
MASLMVAAKSECWLKLLVSNVRLIQKALISIRASAFFIRFGAKTVTEFLIKPSIRYWVNN